MTTRGAPVQPRIRDYSHIEPLPDPPREPDMQQNRRLVPAEGALMAYFQSRKDVVVCGQGYIIENVGDPVQFFPDCVFAYGVNPDSIDDLNGYIIEVTGKPPDFVLEVASRSTGRRDYTVKREGYAALGVREYWRFDYTGGRFHDAPLAGDKLVDGAYVPIEIAHEPDGRHWGYSEALGLELWWDGGMLRFRDPATGEFLPGPEEFDEALKSERAAREFAESRAEFAERRAAEEAAAREQAEAEIQRLREQLARADE